MKIPMAPPLMNELHHHLWSSLASWKYVRATVMNELTIDSMMNARNRIPNRL